MSRTPAAVRLLSQLIRVEQAPNLHHVPDPEWVHGEEPEDAHPEHAHRAYGVYSAAEQRITLDDSLAFEKLRETFLHENLHAMLSISGVDALLDGEAQGLSEHMVGVLAPVLLAWLRDNKAAVRWLQDTQEVPE